MIFVGQIILCPNFSKYSIYGLRELHAIHHWFTPAWDIIDSIVEFMIRLSLADTSLE